MIDLRSAMYIKMLVLRDEVTANLTILFLRWQTLILRNVLQPYYFCNIM